MPGSSRTRRGTTESGPEARAAVTAGEPGTGGAAGFGNAATSAGYGVFPQTFTKGTAVVLDPAGPLAVRPGVQAVPPAFPGWRGVGGLGVFGPLSLLGDERADALAGDDHALVAQDGEGLADGVDRHVRVVGELRL